MIKTVVPVLYLITTMFFSIHCAETIGINVQLDDGNTLSVPENILKKSKTLKNLLLDAQGTIVLPGISTAMFKSVVRYLTILAQQTKTDARQAIAARIAKKKELKKIVQLLNAADYLDIKAIKTAAQAEIIKRLRSQEAINEFMERSSFVKDLGISAYLQQDIADAIMRDHLAKELLNNVPLTLKTIAPMRAKNNLLANKYIAINMVRALSISQDGNNFAISNGTKIYVCNTATQRIDAVIHTPLKSERCVFSHDASLLGVSCTYKEIYIYQLNTQNQIYHKSFDRSVRSFSISCDNQYLLVATADDRVELHAIFNQEVAPTLIHQEHDKWVYQANFNQDCTQVVVSADSGTYIYQIDTLEKIKLLKTLPHSQYATFSFSGALLACGDAQGHVVLHNLLTGIPLKTWDVYTRINGFYFMDNDTKLLVSTFNGVSSIWDIASGIKLHEFEPANKVITAGKGNYILAIRTRKDLLTRYDYPTDAVRIDLHPFFSLEQKLRANIFSLQQVLLINAICIHRDWNEKLVLTPHTQDIMATFDPEIQRILKRLGSIKEVRSK